MDTSALIIVAVAWLLAEARLFLFHRAWARERADLLDRVQAGTLAEYTRLAPGRRKSKTTGTVEVGPAPAPPDLHDHLPAVPSADVIAARAAFRNLTS